MTNLTRHFTLEELTFSETAMRRGIKNEPPEAFIPRLKAVAETLEQVRSEVCHDLPIHVNSGYRSPAVNWLVRGAAHSAHMLGWAVDFVCRQAGTPYELCIEIADSGIQYDKLICEFGGWVHLSIDPQMRRQALTIYQPGHYLPGILTPEEAGP